MKTGKGQGYALLGLSARTCHLETIASNFPSPVSTKEQLALSSNLQESSFIFFEELINIWKHLAHQLAYYLLHAAIASVATKKSAYKCVLSVRNTV